MSANRLFTIGHSNHDFRRLLQLLQSAGVTAVADVRSQPFSQRYPQFNRPELHAGLSENSGKRRSPEATSPGSRPLTERNVA